VTVLKVGCVSFHVLKNDTFNMMITGIDAQELYQMITKEMLYENRKEASATNREDEDKQKERLM
jgi:hypothetical protein